jgi:hypothetical protein
MRFAPIACHLIKERNVMRLSIVVLAAALALVAGCDQRSDPGKPAAGTGNAPPAATDKAPPSQPQVNTPTTPAPSSATTGASAEEKKEGANPVQQQVDPKQSEQHRDFQHKGDAAGPTSPETQPK